MIDINPGYGYNDLCIKPSKITTIDSRKECNPFVKDNLLPLFTAPMSTVVSENNYSLFCDNGIQAIMPRTVKYNKRIDYLNKGFWVALSKKEFIKLFATDDDNFFNEGNTYNVCIDTANGHSESIYESCKVAKELAKKYKYTINIMIGNIANPETYRYIIEKYEGCVDYVRCGIGNGNACITTTQTNVHYPIASLIDECKQIKDDYSEGGDVYAGEYAHVCPAIIADGGIRCYAHIITALALGADYVMIGSLLAALQESAAETITMDGKIYKRYFGMSTKEAQKLINSALETPLSEESLNLKTSEGNVKYLELGTSICRWVRNLVDYMKSAMSYTNARTLGTLRNNTELKVLSPLERTAINK